MNENEVKPIAEMEDCSYLCPDEGDGYVIASVYDGSNLVANLKSETGILDQDLIDTAKYVFRQVHSVNPMSLKTNYQCRIITGTLSGETLGDIDFSESPMTTLPVEFFKGCEISGDVILPKKLYIIPYGCFEDCTLHRHLELPETVIQLNNKCFNGTQLSDGKLDLSRISNLVGVVFFEGCNIEEYNYSSLYNVPSLGVNTNDTRIVSSDFEGVLKLPRFNNNNGNLRFEGFKIRQIWFGKETCTWFTSFNGCSALKNCKNLEFIVFERPTPYHPGTDCIDYLSYAPAIYVPDESVEIYRDHYRAAYVGEQYLSKIRPISEINQ